MSPPFPKIEYHFDVISLLNYFKGILTNAAFERLTGINQLQMSHYANGLKKPRKAQRQKIEKALHQLGEDLRKLYVALTRSRHYCYLGLAALKERSAIGYLLSDSGLLEPTGLAARLALLQHPDPHPAHPRHRLHPVERDRHVPGQRFRFQFVLLAALQHRMNGQREHQYVENDQCPDQPETQGAWRRIKTEREHVSCVMVLHEPGLAHRKQRERQVLLGVVRGLTSRAIGTLQRVATGAISFLKSKLSLSYRVVLMALAVGLLVYLIAALLNPEDFS